MCGCFLCLSFAAVSTNLEDSLASSAKATLQAIGAQEAALQAIIRHTNKLKVAMEAEVQTTLTLMCMCVFSCVYTYIYMCVFLCVCELRCQPRRSLPSGKNWKLRSWKEPLQWMMLGRLCPRQSKTMHRCMCTCTHNLFMVTVMTMH